MQDDRSEREKHLEELYEAMKAKVHELEREIQRLTAAYSPEFEPVIQYREES